MQVGGDGLFQEVLDGIAALRCSEDERRAAAAAQLRLGHIPGGSTDAAAYSMHGTRSAATAALHAALGDRSVCPSCSCMGLDKVSQTLPGRHTLDGLHCCDLRKCSPPAKKLYRVSCASVTS